MLKEYLKVLFQQLKEFLQIGEIRSDVELTRFIYDSKRILATGRVKPRAFKPDSRRETSVFLLDGFSYAEKLEHEILHGRAGKKPKGYAITSTGLVRQIDLKTVHTIRPPKHAAIRGWPSEPEIELQKTQELAADASRRGGVLCS